MSIAKVISDFVADRDFARAADIAAFIVTKIEEELGIPIPANSALARPVIYRGATTYAREALKKPRVIEELLEEVNADQPDLFEEYSEMVWIGAGEDGENLFGRRKALTREQYQKALDLLRAKATELREKINRFQDDFDRAAPHWLDTMTFGVAISLAARHHPSFVTTR
jgi:hypothetical protein